MSAVTLGLVYFTYRLSRYTRELNRIEKSRDEQRRLDLRVYQLNEALAAANRVLEINTVNFAWRVNLRVYQPFLQEIRLLEGLWSYTSFFEKSERPFIEKLIREVLSNCDNSRLGGIVPTQEAMTAQINQLKEKVALQISKLRDQRDESEKRAIGVVHKE